MDNNLIGEQITRYRKERNMTQEELGKAAGVSTQAVSRWENGGAPDVALLPAIRPGWRDHRRPFRPGGRGEGGRSRDRGPVAGGGAPEGPV